MAPGASLSVGTSPVPRSAVASPETQFRRRASAAAACCMQRESGGAFAAADGGLGAAMLAAHAVTLLNDRAVPRAGWLRALVD